MECVDQTAETLMPCLQPPKADEATPMECFMDGKLVYECHGETCTAYGPLEDETPHRNFKTCPLLQFSNVPLNLLNHHYVCCTPNGTFHRYLYACPGNNSTPSLPSEFLVCNNQDDDGMKGGTGTKDTGAAPIIAAGPIIAAAPIIAAPIIAAALVWQWWLWSLFQ